MPKTKIEPKVEKKVNAARQKLKGSELKKEYLKQGKTELTQNERSKYSRQLVYAYRNRVRPQHLVGFIYQTGGSKVIDARLKGILPDFSPIQESTAGNAVLENWRNWSLLDNEIWPWYRFEDE